MSDYPIRSTARQFFDIDGKPCTLSQLVKSEPEWAVSRIFTLEENQAELVKALEYALERTWVDDSVSVYKSALEKAKS